MAMTGGTAKLVKTGYPNYGTETSFPLRLYVYYMVASQDEVNAITTLSLGMYFTVPSKWYVGPWSDYGSYIGTTANTFHKDVPSNFSGTLWLVENVTMKVQHDAQGKGTANIKWKWGVDSSYGQMESPSGSFNVALPDIPRSSTASITGSAEAGATVTISVKRASASFTHTLRYALGEASGTIAEDVGTSASWVVPYDLLKEFPSAKSAKATLYCDTYNGATKLGTSSSQITVTAPDNDITKPAASMTLSPVSDLSVDAYVKGRSKVQATFEASSEYSSIKSSALTVEGATTDGNPAVSGILNNSGEVTITGIVTDARGYSRTMTETIAVIAYDIPRVAPATGQNSVICQRGLSSGETSGSGLYLVIKAARKYSALTVDGQQTNFCELRFRHKQTSAEVWSDWVTLIEAQDLATDQFTGALPNVVSSATTSYAVQIGVVDSIGGEWVQEFVVPTEEVAFHLKPGGKGAAFFGYSERDRELTVYGNINYTGHLLKGGNPLLEIVYPVGSIYMSAVETDPAMLFGFGTWARILDRFLLAAGDVYEAGSTGGEESHVLTVGEMPEHSHRLLFQSEKLAAGSDYSRVGGTYQSGVVESTGGGQAHNNMPPYVAVYIWQRTA